MKTAALFSIASLLLVAGALGAGCGGSSGGYAALGVGGSNGGGGDNVAGSDGAVGDGAAGADGGLVSGARVFGGTARLLYNGPSCTQEAGATGDRWCAFVAFTDPVAQTRSLYVFNASRAASGAPVSCGAGSGGADPDCLLLTADLGGDGAGLHGTFFGGDTLVYYEYQQGPLAPYVWRPGMTRGRLLATFVAGEDALYCTPAPRGTAVLCVLLPATDPDPNVSFADLLIGKADGADEPLLSVADNVVLSSAADAGFRPTFSFGFPPGSGDYVAWTTRDGATGPETLKLQTAGDAASKTTIAPDVHQWNVSPDAARWFWLSGTLGTGVGTLRTAPFPGGANPTDVRGDVADYDISPSDAKTVVALIKNGGLVAIADPIAAGGELVLDTPVQALLSIGPAGHVAYAKTRFGGNSGDLYVTKADGTGACVVEPARQVPFAMVNFLPGGTAILSGRASGDAYEASYTRLRDCNTMSIAAGITLIAPMGDRRVLFADQYDDATGTATLRIRSVGSDDTLTAAAPIPIADHVDSYSITAATSPALVYTVNASGQSDGLYVRGFSD
ncbi:MAG TPA: hypothetical protein VKQ32_23380 [Polyangia bacterium]|nr:hypothetical protein [Polyangia bacterium]